MKARFTTTKKGLKAEREYASTYKGRLRQSVEALVDMTGSVREATKVLGSKTTPPTYRMLNEDIKEGPGPSTYLCLAKALGFDPFAFDDWLHCRIDRAELELQSSVKKRKQSRQFGFTLEFDHVMSYLGYLDIPVAQEILLLAIKEVGQRAIESANPLVKEMPTVAKGTVRIPPIYADRIGRITEDLLQKYGIADLTAKLNLKRPQSVHDIASGNAKGEPTTATYLGLARAYKADAYAFNDYLYGRIENDEFQRRNLQTSLNKARLELDDVKRYILSLSLDKIDEIILVLKRKILAIAKGETIQKGVLHTVSYNQVIDWANANIVEIFGNLNNLFEEYPVESQELYIKLLRKEITSCSTAQKYALISYLSIAFAIKSERSPSETRNLLMDLLGAQS